MGHNQEKITVINKELERVANGFGELSPLLSEAMQYSLMAGGKRFRPLLHIMTGEALGLRIEALLPTACAIELVHTYSLIHDDLPALDNDSLRRGKPTSHIVFGEDTAIMAGDALFAESFFITLSNTLIQPEALLSIVRELASVAGARGMVGGQMLDLRAVGIADEESLMKINNNKTAKLIAFSIESAGIAAELNSSELKSLKHYGLNLGIAFQVIDDVLDVAGEESKIGKDVGSDTRKNKTTLATLVGVDEAKDRARELLSKAESALNYLEYDFSRLIELGRSVTERDC